MSIVNLIILIIISILISDLLGKKTQDVVPPFVFALLLILYAVAFLGKAHHSYQGTVILFVLICILYFVRKKRLFPDVVFLKENVFTPGFVIYLIVIAIMFIAYSSHFVIVWDDFHYNATFPKDMYYYGAMPYGNHSATFYRSYPPLMQLFFYWGFQGIGGFSEPLMFEYKQFLIYTCLLPLFKQAEKREGRVCKLMTAVICICIPFLFMFELMESLSMDSFMAALFGYALIIIMEENKARFDFTGIILSLSCLTLVKQIAPIFTVIALASWAAMLLRGYFRKDGSGRREILPWLIAAVSSACCYLSWKIFCDSHGNSVYLSGKLSSSLGGDGILLPEYGRETIRNFLKSIVTLNLDLSHNGLTLLAAVIITALAFAVMLKLIPERADVKPAVFMIFAGLFGYLAVLLYTYLFVFEDWEAVSLSSIDRYFGTYALALMYLAASWVFVIDEKSNEMSGRKAVLCKWVLPAFTLICLVCFPWKNAYANLVPSVYDHHHEGARNELERVADELSGISPQSLEVRKVMVVSDQTNTLYSRGMVYNMIPLVPDEFVIEDDDDRSQALLDKCRDDSVYYVYFAERLVDGENIDSIKNALSEDVQPRSGQIYIYDAERNIITDPGDGD